MLTTMRLATIFLLCLPGLHAANAYRASVITLIAANAADAATSYGHLEANPAFRSERFGAGAAGMKFGLLTGDLLLQHHFLRTRPRWRKPMIVANFAASAVLAGVAYRNSRIKP